MHYRIRFQNTGFDTDFTIIARDTLSPFLDSESVRLGTTSRPVEFERHNNMLAFYFKNIRLSYRNTNEPGSIGCLNYYVKQRSSNPEQYEILNNASIYFDFNDPNVSNTHRHTIRPFVPIAPNTLPNTSEILLFPNPANSQVQIVFPNEFQSADLQLFDLSGRIIWQINAAPNGYILDLQALKEGISYIGDMQDKTWMSVFKMVRLGK